MGKLDGKVAVITGSTSGMGRDTAYLFAKEGAKVLVTGRNEERAKAVVDKIREDGGVAEYVLANTQDLASADIIFNACMEKFGTCDILINNAGQLSVTPIFDLTLEEFTQCLNVNVTMAFLLGQKFGKVMFDKGRGHIVNISSIAGTSAHWGPTAYCTTKFAMNGLTRAMANEMGPKVRVNGIQPGAIKTAMLDSVGGEAACGFMIERSPLKRVAEGSEIATAALFLCTDESSFIDGQLIRVDGGVDC
ncbi:MAG: SDR family oxidoreductase [Lachnospiraceae bacterium]|nr:SDR family oxidoreductase [Lachnospiraceae bacterium]